MYFTQSTQSYPGDIQESLLGALPLYTDTYTQLQISNSMPFNVAQLMIPLGSESVEHSMGESRPLGS